MFKSRCDWSTWMLCFCKYVLFVLSFEVLANFASLLLLLFDICILVELCLFKPFSCLYAMGHLCAWAVCVYSRLMLVMACLSPFSCFVDIRFPSYCVHPYSRFAFACFLIELPIVVCWVLCWALGQYFLNNTLSSSHASVGVVLAVLLMYVMCLWNRNLNDGCSICNAILSPLQSQEGTIFYVFAFQTCRLFQQNTINSRTYDS